MFVTDWKNTDRIISERKISEPNLLQGRKLGAFALSEPEAGSDATKQKTTADKDGDFYSLNGMKNWITNGKNADYFLVMASTDKENAHHGISTILVEKGTEGFTHGKKEDKLGIRSSDTCYFNFRKLQSTERKFSMGRR